MTIEETKTFAELVRIGAVTTVNGKLNPNIGENMFTPSLADNGDIELCDGQITCHGSDEDLSAALSALAKNASFEDAWDALSDFERNA